MQNFDLNNIIEEWSSTKNYKLIKAIKLLSNSKAAYKICKRKYRETKDIFYINSMKHINMFYKLKSITFLHKEKAKLIQFENKIANINNLIKSIVGENKKFVYIFQFSFFDPKGENYFSGGGERYACDLAKILVDNGFFPILIQKGEENSEKPWVNDFKDLKVIGINADSNDYVKIISMLPKPCLAIYSGVINWDENKYYHPSILISHGITWDYPFYNANTQYLKKIIKLADTFVSVDTNTISWFRSTFSKDIKDFNIKMKYIPNYVDLEKYIPVKRTNKRIKITYPRRCSDERGFWLIADIVPVILDTYENVEFDFVGFAHTEKIKNKIEELKLKYGDRVNHYVVDSDKMPEIYKQTDITVIPTIYSEGTSLSCIEAMASGNAVIATDIGGLPNLIINNYNGLLVEPDILEIKNAIQNLITDDNLRNKLSKNAIDVAQAFSKETWIKNWEKILKDTINFNKNNTNNNNSPNTNLKINNKNDYYENLQNIQGLNLCIQGKNNIIEIDKSVKFLDCFINIDSNNSHIKINKIKYMRYSKIYVYNGDNQSILIDDETSIEGLNIYSCGEASKLKIEKNCMLANGISIWTADGHSVFDKTTGKLLNGNLNKVIIGENTWIAQDCKLLKKAKIPPNSIVGANSVVTKEFNQENVLIAGNPAKIVKENIFWDRKDPYSYEKRENVKNIC